MGSTQDRWLRRTIYSLTRLRGQPISLRRTIDDATDFQTGDQTATLVSVTVKRGSVLPSKAARDFARIQTDVSQNQDFAYGGFFDTRVRTVLIRSRDVPSDFPIDENMHLVFPINRDGSLAAGARRYQVEHVWDLGEAYVFATKAMDGAIIDTTVASPFPPAQATPPATNLRRVVAKVADYVVLATDNGTIFTNEGALGPIKFTLPAWLSGSNFEFRTVAPFEVDVDSHVGDQLQVGGLAGTQAANSTPGGILSVVADAASVWGGTTQGDWDIT